MDVVVWLRSLGLGKYEAAFRENEIDETVLPGLTAEDLKELGVAALGHRSKLLDAIAALPNEAGVTAFSAAAGATSVGGLKTHAPLQTRVGIATGLVVVGDLIGSGASQEQAIIGETPNLAARLQGVAEPNSVVISESTRKLVGNLFELEDLGRGSRALHGRCGQGLCCDRL
jgi:class 3 adenylate cyclase